MMEKTVTKLWQNKFVSVRDYDVAAAIKKGGLRIKHNGKVMELTPEELKVLPPPTQIVQSKYKGTYGLVDITFKPLTENPDQHKLI